MNGTLTAWSGNWRDRIRQRLRDAGFATIHQYLREFPGATYLELSDRLGCTIKGGGKDIAATQLQRIQFEEISSTCELRDAAMDALVRLLRQHLKKGWNLGGHAEFNRAGAKVDWVSLVATGTTLPNAATHADAVWNRLISLEPDSYWRPESTQDPLIQDAFNHAWPFDQEA